MRITERLQAIGEILGRETIVTQEALLGKLKERGIICTQATLSRNLRQLGVSRVPDGKGTYRYSLTGHGPVSPDAGPIPDILPGIRSLTRAAGMLLMKTIPGGASATAYFIDNSGRYEIAGTIAGDDTILIIPRDGVTQKQVIDCLEIIIPGLKQHAVQINPRVSGKEKE